MSMGACGASDPKCKWQFSNCKSQTKTAKAESSFSHFVIPPPQNCNICEGCSTRPKVGQDEKSKEHEINEAYEPYPQTQFKHHRTGGGTRRPCAERACGLSATLNSGCPP